MNYSTLERFKGAWLGSILGDALSSDRNKSDYIKIFQYRLSNWINKRERIAQFIINNSLKNFTSQEYTKISSEYCSTKFHKDAIYRPLATKTTSQTDLTNYCCYLISTLLPAIFFPESDLNTKNIYKKIISQYDVGQTNLAEKEQEMAVWSYLLAAILNNGFQLEEPNVSMIVQQVLSGAGIKTTSLIARLEIISQAWKKGFSLQQLAERLEQQENSEKKTILTADSAIVLSLYCFASTPKNFMLSVKRAANIVSRLSVPATVLTASLSGAYNGMSGIPENWLVATRHHQFYERNLKTVTEIFKTWSGVYQSNSIEVFYDLETFAIATPGIFQPRQKLKIISQTSTLI